jgi:hypothetical protein
LTTFQRNSWGFSLFCDDIRAEVGGKMSVMGIYQADMVFPPSVEFPILIPKFCILIKYYELKDAFNDDIIMRVYMPGDAKGAPSLALPFPRTQLNTDTPPPYPLDDDQERIFNLTFPLAVAPFQINQAGFIKVRAVCGSTITNLGSLMVRVARSDEQIPSFSPSAVSPPTG